MPSSPSPSSSEKNKLCSWYSSSQTWSKKAQPALTYLVWSLVWTVTSWATALFTLGCNNSIQKASQVDFKSCTNVMYSVREVLALLSASGIKCLTRGAAALNFS